MKEMREGTRFSSSALFGEVKVGKGVMLGSLLQRREGKAHHPHYLLRRGKEGTLHLLGGVKSSKGER